jgi:hypothetical protein
MRGHADGRECQEHLATQDRPLERALLWPVLRSRRCVGLPTHCPDHPGAGTHARIGVAQSVRGQKARDCSSSSFRNSRAKSKSTLSIPRRSMTRSRDWPRRDIEGSWSALPRRGLALTRSGRQRAHLSRRWSGVSSRLRLGFGSAWLAALFLVSRLGSSINALLPRGMGHCGDCR